jgi:hypothetical protein
VLEDRYGANVTGMAVRKGQIEWLGYVSEFIAESKASGMVQQAMEPWCRRQSDEYTAATGHSINPCPQIAMAVAS